MTKRESLRNHTQTRPTAAEAELWKAGLRFIKKLDHNEGVEEWERYLALGWCCFGVAWWAGPGCWGSVCGPGCWRLVAGPQPTGAVQFWGHAKWLSDPGGCEHTTSLNISASVTSRQPDGWEARGALGLGPALPVLPDVRVHLHPRGQRHGSRERGLWQASELTGHVCSWMKLTETTPVAKPVGTFSVCLQLISQSARVVSTVCFSFPFNSYII